MSTNQPFRAAVSLGLMFCCWGCSKKGSDLPTVPVTGTIKLNGTPLEGATVAFHSSDPDAKPATGITDAQGRYRLQTYISGASQTDGAVPGNYRVTVQKFETSSGGTPTPEEAVEKAKNMQVAMENAEKAGKGGQPAGKIPGATMSSIPEKYSGNDSPLTADVEKGKDNVKDFDLTD